MPGMKDTMMEYKAGKLHSGSKMGPMVTDKKQAMAIAMSQATKGLAKGSQPSGYRAGKTYRRTGGK